MSMDKQRYSDNSKVREEANNQPKKVQDDRPGYGDKKLEGPDRPST
ncbi:hypothetical protein [Brevibacillus daliensis]|nr:hypothetical protein [Brevibacillus daliensis]